MSKTISPIRLDRIQPKWVEWFIQTQKAAAATALANVASIQAQIDNAGIIEPAARAHVGQQIYVLESQALVHLSVEQLCSEVFTEPYFTRNTIDVAIDKALIQILEATKDEEERREQRAGLWKLCKILGVPMGRVQQ